MANVRGVCPPVDEPTLAALLTRRGLELRTVVAPTAEQRELPVDGVHSSDLADPTPFLTEGVALLTTGTQFMPDVDAQAASAYVARLRTRGLVALGFGTDVVRDGIPEPLVHACRAQQLPLFEVPYRTPFIAVARANAEAIAARDYARRSWALAAQRALSLAALRPDGLRATLEELSRQLDCWVGLFDAAGALSTAHPSAGLDHSLRDDLGDEVAGLLARGVRAGSTLTVAETTFTIQTLGRGGHLRGALVIAAGSLDQQARSVLTMVVAMAGLALEQRHGLSRAQSRLRTGLASALLSGETGLVRSVARDVWGGLPPEPVALALADPAVLRREDAAEWLEIRGGEQPGSFFHARVPEGLLVLASASDRSVPDALARRFAVAVGLSAPARYDELPRALGQARLALDRSGPGVTAFADLPTRMTDALEAGRARTLAQARLEPLLAHDRAHGTRLREALESWLENDGSHDVTARALGVHRHTVRSRIQQAGRLLGTDLTSFADRADVWLALRSLREEP